MTMKHKQKILAATMFLKNGEAVRGLHDMTPAGDWKSLAKAYNDGGIDKIFVFDLSDDEREHEKNLHTIRELNRFIEIPTCGGGNVKYIEDIKKLFYAGCKQVIVNGSKPYCFELVDEGSTHFGNEKILVSVKNVDFIFKHKNVIKEKIHELLVLNAELLDSIDNLTDTQYVTCCETEQIDAMVNILRRHNSRGIYGMFLNDTDTNVMELKSQLASYGIEMDNFEPALKWSDFKLNSDGMVPVITQDYRTNEVLMLAYMNEEAFNNTIRTGKMTYYSRSRGELWVKGMTSGHFQYVKSLTADCDYDTILAKVSQTGAACHTGNYSCFFNEIVYKEYMEKNPLKALESKYAQIMERKEHPKKGTYTTSLMEQGTDYILRMFGAEAAGLVVAVKNEDPDIIKRKMSDFLYNMMVLMVETNITWEDIMRELTQQ